MNINGKKVIYSYDNIVYKYENLKEINLHKIENKITCLNVNFEKNLLICGDNNGNLLIKNFCKNENKVIQTFPNIFKNNSFLSCISIYKNVLSVSNNNGNINFINLNDYNITKGNDINYPNKYNISLLIVEIDFEYFVIINGKSIKIRL